MFFQQLWKNKYENNFTIFHQVPCLMNNLSTL